MEVACPMLIHCLRLSAVAATIMSSAVCVACHLLPWGLDQSFLGRESANLPENDSPRPRLTDKNSWEQGKSNSTDSRNMWCMHIEQSGQFNVCHQASIQKLNQFGIVLCALVGVNLKGTNFSALQSFLHRLIIAFRLLVMKEAFLFKCKDLCLAVKQKIVICLIIVPHCSLVLNRCFLVRVNKCPAVCHQSLLVFQACPNASCIAFQAWLSATNTILKAVVRQRNFACLKFLHKPFLSQEMQNVIPDRPQQAVVACDSIFAHVCCQIQEIPIYTALICLIFSIFKMSIFHFQCIGVIQETLRFKPSNLLCLGMPKI